MSAILDPRSAWLARRRELVTASDIAAILGEDERRGPLAVYAAKVGDVESEETLPMRRGRRMEGAIADEYAEQTGREVLDLGAHEIQIHPDVPWLGATLDRVTCRDAATRGPLEIKLAIGSGHQWRNEPPLAYLFQVQVEIACYAAPWGSLAGLVGPGPLSVSDHERDEDLLGLMLPKLEHFRWHVERRLPTACEHEGCVMHADAKPGTSAAVRRLWGTVGRETVPLDDEALRLVERWETRKALAAESDKAAKAIENELRARLGDAAFGALPDGRFVRRVARKRGSYTVEPAEWVQLDVWRPHAKAR